MVDRSSEVALGVDSTATRQVPPETELLSKSTPLVRDHRQFTENATFKELRCNSQIAADSTGMSLHLRFIFRDRARTMHAFPRRDKASR